MEQRNIPARAERQELDPYRLLRQRIIEFELLPGGYISENGLAAELGVSRTPVREVLARLEEEGCIRVYPQRGTQVSLISMERIRQAVFLRSTLEQDVAKEICRNGLTEAQRQELEASLALQRKFYAGQKSSALLNEDTRMHRLLYRFCGREAAWDAFTAINCDMMRTRYLQILTFSYKVPMVALDSWENKLTEHRMILDALEQKNGTKAALLCAGHIEGIERSADTLRRIYPQYFEQGD